jgi:peptide/nickel transport system substrate-binding protein
VHSFLFVFLRRVGVRLDFSGAHPVKPAVQGIFSTAAAICERSLCCSVAFLTRRNYAVQRREFFTTAARTAAILAAPHLAQAQGARVLKFVPQADLAVLDPVSSAYVTRNHAFLVFDTLYGIDETYQPRPQMVAGHAVEDDGKLWTLNLRDGLLFHDGQKVLARDAIASIKRWAARDPFGSWLTSITDELSAPSDKQIRLRLKKPFPMLPLALGHTMLAIMPERIAATPSEQQVTEMVGSGPYRFLPGERVAGSLAAYQRFEGYVPRSSGVSSFTAGPKIATVERIEWHTIPDAATAAAALQSGEVDWWELPTNDLLPLLRKNPAITTEIIDRAGNIGVLRLNSLYPPFDSPAIKHALLGAINQADFMQAVAGVDPQMWRTGAGVFPPGTPLANSAGMEVFSDQPDYDRVKGELVAAGYRGEKVTFIAAADFPAINALCEVGADAFRKVGINLDYQALDWGTVTTRRNSQEPPSKGGWNAHCTYAAGYDLLTPGNNFSLNAVGRQGFVGWSTNPRLTALRNAWFDAPDLGAQQKICVDIQMEFMRDPPYLPLGQFFAPTAYRKKITGIPRGSFSLFWGIKMT